MNEVREIGIEEEGADEYVPRVSRGEKDDARTRDSVRGIPRGDSNLRRDVHEFNCVYPPRRLGMRRLTN